VLPDEFVLAGDEEVPVVTTVTGTGVLVVVVVEVEPEVTSNASTQT
jgi:hypothetical protein